MINSVKSKGFTLVEIAIVIVVIGILAAITIVAYTEARDRARDARRISDAKTITEALKLYHTKNFSYPTHTSANGSWETSHEDGPGDFMEYLVEGGHVDTVPIDPTNEGNMHYSYHYYSAGNGGCDGDKGRFFVFGIKDMETSERPHPDSPGWACDTRSWDAEFDWVTGGYVN